MVQWNAWRWLATCALVPTVVGCATTRGVDSPVSPAPITTTAVSSPTAGPPVVASNPDPARFAEPVVVHAREAGVSPQLVMTILYNESYKPHDPASERAWLQIKPDAALGVANMHQATFDQVKQRRSFARRNWQELPDDPDLAIQAAAWYLHDLATDVPAKRPAALTVEELLALGYNAGPGNMKLFAQGDALGAQAQAYLDTFRRNWAKAGVAVGRG
jgi:hypothetical protein